MKKRCIRPFVFSLMVLALCGAIMSASYAAPAATRNPIQLLQHLSHRMLDALRANNHRIKRDKRLVFRIVYRILLPYVDLKGMSRSVLGRRTWRSITPAQRGQFSKAFTTLVIRTYASALQNYTNETVHFFPIRGGYQGRNRVQVLSQIVRKQGPTIPVSYRLVRRGSSWKVYDFSVEGISLIRSFQSQFAAQLSNQSFKQVLLNLQKHNRKNG